MPWVVIYVVVEVWVIKACVQVNTDSIFVDQQEDEKGIFQFLGDEMIAERRIGSVNLPKTFFFSSPNWPFFV